MARQRKGAAGLAQRTACCLQTGGRVPHPRRLDATNGSTTTPTPASGLTESERLAAIIVPSLVGGLLLIGLVIFGALKVRERRQTEGTYRPSNEEQVGARVVTNTNLQLPPEERLI
ncbi:protein crumbs homolog 3-like isoform X2 [Mauremys mutica]|uniref:protein crumbs homolog 3-like isoform X2 n=1 Tax=Mauremys mutica TaxID=74926 RepID=UPI001D163715|nr:protein crumbs homolog 3-like isoform X2 [Mauremys mutica]